MCDTNDRLINDAKLCETLGQMLTRAGLQVRVETMPANMLFSRIRMPAPEFSAVLLGWGHSDTTDISPLLTTIVHSYDAQRGFGTSNRGLYADPEVDQRIEAVLPITEPEARRRAIEEVMALLDTKLPDIPLHTQFILMGTRRSIDYKLRRDEATLAMGASPARAP